MAAGVIATVGLVVFCFYRKNTKMIVVGECLYICKGVLLKRCACLNAADVTAVVARRSLIDIMARSTKVTLFTEAGAVCGREGIRIFAESENNLCDTLGFVKGVREKKSSLSQTLLQALSTTSVATGTVFLLPIMRKLDMLLTDNETTADKIERIGETVFGMSPLMNLAATFILIAFAVSLLLFVLRYAGNTSKYAADSAAISFGMLPKNTIYMRTSAIDSVAEVQPPLLFLLKKSFLKAEAAGLKNNKKREIFLSPPLAQGEKLHTSHACGETWQYFKGYFLFFCFGAIVLLVVHILFAPLSDLVTVLFSALTVSAYYRFRLAKYSHRYTYTDLYAGKAHFVRGARVIRTKFNRDKIGIIQITTFPYDRKMRLCTIKMVMRSENATKIRAKYVSEEKTCGQLKSLYKKE